MKVLFHNEANFNFSQKSFPHATFFSHRILTVKKNNTGYFVSLNISLAFSSNAAATFVGLVITWPELLWSLTKQSILH